MLGSQSTQSLVASPREPRPIALGDQHRAAGAETRDRAGAGAALYRGLIVAIPLSLALWALVLWGFGSVVL